MTDKKFTDEEIIKAIGNLFKNTDGLYEVTIQNSTKGVYGEKQYYCIPEGVYNLIMRQSGFIDRQKTEIERLKECPKCVYEYDGEITEYCIQGPCPNFKTVEQIKVEAYKEFAEKLKDAAMPYLRGGKYYEIITTRCIDTLLKEMVGEEE